MKSRQVSSAPVNNLGKISSDMMPILTAIAAMSTDNLLFKSHSSQAIMAIIAYLNILIHNRMTLCDIDLNITPENTFTLRKTISAQTIKPLLIAALLFITSFTA